MERSCSCEHMAKGCKSMGVQQLLPDLLLHQERSQDRYRTQSCSKATEMKGILSSSISQGPPGKPWTAAKLWAKKWQVLQLQTPMASIGSCSKRNRRREVA